VSNIRGQVPLTAYGLLTVTASALALPRLAPGEVRDLDRYSPLRRKPASVNWSSSARTSAAVAVHATGATSSGFDSTSATARASPGS
jgi:hypothetical protein